MKNIICIVACIFTLQVVGQVSRTYVIDGNVYYKATGKKVPEKVYVELIKNNPNLYLEPVIDKSGKVTRFLYDPDNQTGQPMILTRTEEDKVQVGSVFPDFEFKSTDGELLKSKKLTGKWIVLRFELMMQVADKEELRTYDRFILDASKSSEVISIVSFADSKLVVDDLSVLNKEAHHLVSSASRFHQKYQLTKFPTTMVIDPQGILRGYYYFGETIKLE